MRDNGYDFDLFSVALYTIFAALAIVLIFLVGDLVVHGEKVYKPNVIDRESHGHSLPDMTIIESKDDYADGAKFTYVVDNNTGVVYIYYRDYSQGSVCPAYNSDGTVMMKDQIPKEREMNNEF